MTPPAPVIPETPLTDEQRQQIVDSVVLDTPVNLDNRPSWCDGNVVDARGPLRTAGNSSGGLNVGNGISAPAGGCVIGPAVRANWSRDLTWRDASHAGDGVVWGQGGSTAVYGAYIDNFGDALAPPKSPTTPRTNTWHVSNIYARYTRDELVENDACLEGTVHDSLVDGGFIFISARPGKGNTVDATGHTTVTNTLIGLECQPTEANGEPAVADLCPKHRPLTHGQLFKWSACGGTVTMKNVIARFEANKPVISAMNFVGGTYENVWIVYLPPGNYPHPLPEGVRQTKDDKLWQMARKKWMDRHGCDEKGDHCTFTDKKR